jgi:N-acetyl-D-muramate 6-phosphate phosphatase
LSLSVNHVLFDLDGTLADTAPDLAYALNQVRREYGEPPLAYMKIRSVVSLGGAAMIKLAFAKAPGDSGYDQIRTRFLDIYLENILRETRLFPGIERVLDTLDAENRNWGIVTNKPGWLTDPLLEKMKLSKRAGCVISGDTLPFSKPHPEPLLHACRLMNCLPAETVYIGDAQRDIEAGKNAGMPTVIAGYGYIEEDTALDSWGANLIINSPIEILEWLSQQKR